MDPVKFRLFDATRFDVIADSLFCEAAMSRIIAPHDAKANNACNFVQLILREAAIVP